MRKILGLLVAACLVTSGCSFGSSSSGRGMTAEFSRAVQVFPGNSVRVLGVTVGRVTKVTNGDDNAEVVIRIDDPDIKLPADVKATIIPVSLLGERYIQLFPAYTGGPTFDGDRIEVARTSVPAEQDELLRGLQDYFGALDPDKVADFVTNAAEILQGNGEGLNRLIDKGSSVVQTLARKRDSLAELIQELDTLTVSLSTRQAAIGRLLHSYNTVAKALTGNRDALEGTIGGLNAAATQLASLLTEHRKPLASDIEALTTSLSTLSRNAETFARTGKWAERLFDAASKAVDYDQNWLRLGNQGEPLFELITFRLEDRLKGVCLRLGVPQCSSLSFWDGRLPDLFCTSGCKAKDQKTPGEALDEALKSLPDEVGDSVGKELDALSRNCKKAKHPKKCRKRKRQAKRKQSEGDALDKLIDDLLDGVDTTTGDLTGGTGL